MSKQIFEVGDAFVTIKDGQDVEFEVTGVTYNEEDGVRTNFIYTVREPIVEEVKEETE